MTVNPRMYEGRTVSFNLLTISEYTVGSVVRGYVRLAMEKARKTLPKPETSRRTQLPRLAYCVDERYLVPTEGISMGVVNCQTAMMTTMIRRNEARIFPLGPMSDKPVQ